jgi:hypothetical protein
VGFVSELRWKCGAERTIAGMLRGGRTLRTRACLSSRAIVSSLSAGEKVATRRRDGKIGDRFERAELRPLRRAVVAALLDRVPPEIGKKEDTQGWHVATSDNALLHG